MHLYSSSELNAISDIIHVLNGAATDGDLSDALTQICAAVQSQAGGLVLMRSDGRGPGDAVLHNVDDNFFRKYRDEYFARDFISFRAMAAGFRIWRPTDIVTQREWENSEIFTGLLRHQGMFHTMIAAFGTALAPIGQMFLTRAKLDEPFSDKDMRLIEIIHPHLETALRAITLSMMTDKIGASLINGVDTMARPVFILDERNAPVYMNAQACRMCAAMGLSEQEMLSEICMSLETWNAFGEPGSMESKEAFCTLDGHTYGLYSVVVAGSEAGYRVVMLVSGLLFIQFSLQLLSARHGLTERESEVCGMLVHGLANKEIAASLFISDETVKDHVKAVVSKLHLRSRAEVPPLILGLL